MLLSPVGAVNKSGQGAGAEAGLHLPVQVQEQITTQGPEAVSLWACRPPGTGEGPEQEVVEVGLVFCKYPSVAMIAKARVEAGGHMEVLVSPGDWDRAGEKWLDGS